MLGERGCTVYCTGRTTEKSSTATELEAENSTLSAKDSDCKPSLDRNESKSTVETSTKLDVAHKETIEETARLVTSLGGKGIAVAVDHGDEDQV